MTSPDDAARVNLNSQWSLDTLRLAFLERMEEMDRRIACELSAIRDLSEQREAALDQRLHRQFDSIESVAKERDKAWRDMLVAFQSAVDARFVATTAAQQSALESAKEAILTARTANEKRFDSVNEFRGQMADQARTFMPRGEANAMIQSNQDKIDALDKRLQNLNLEQRDTRGRNAGLDAAWGYLIGFVGLVGAVIAIIIAFANN